MLATSGAGGKAPAMTPPRRSLTRAPTAPIAVKRFGDVGRQMELRSTSPSQREGSARCLRSPTAELVLISMESIPESVMEEGCEVLPIGVWRGDEAQRGEWRGGSGDRAQLGEAIQVDEEAAQGRGVPTAAVVAIVAQGGGHIEGGRRVKAGVIDQSCEQAFDRAHARSTPEVVGGTKRFFSPCQHS